MYDILYRFVSHVWQTQNVNSTEQQIYVYASVTLGLLLVCIFADQILGLFRSLSRNRGRR